MKLLSFWYRRRRIPLKEARLGDIYTAEGIWRKPEMFMPKVVGIIADIKRRDAGDYCLLLVSPEEPKSCCSGVIKRPEAVRTEMIKVLYLKVKAIHL